MATSAPSAARRRATKRPRRLAAPVTRATRPDNSFLSDVSLGMGRSHNSRGKGSTTPAIIGSREQREDVRSLQGLRGLRKAPERIASGAKAHWLYGLYARAEAPAS